LSEENFSDFIQLERAFKEDYIRRLLDNNKEKRSLLRARARKKGDGLFVRTAGMYSSAGLKRSLKVIQRHMCNKKGTVREATKQEIEDFKTVEF